MEVYSNGESVRVILEDKSEMEVRPYNPEAWPQGVAGLADGYSHNFPDGCTVTRCGRQERWLTPAPSKLR